MTATPLLGQITVCSGQQTVQLPFNAPQTPTRVGVCGAEPGSGLAQRETGICHPPHLVKSRDLPTNFI